MKAHFFDLDTLITANNKIWLVDKKSPDKSIIKIDKSEFNLIKKGIYKNLGHKLEISGEIYYLPEDLLNKIKIRTKVTKTDISNLAFSMQEFLNKELMESLEYEIHLDNIMHLKNKTDDIYVICSKNTKNNYEKFIEKLESKLLDEGLKIKKFYHISETFYNRDEEEISHKKVRLLLQHLVGLKTEVDKFADIELEEYDTIEYYDDERATIDTAKNCMKIMEFLTSNTETGLKERIKDKTKKVEKVISINLVTPNKWNRFINDKVIIRFPNLIKTFESFNMNKWRC